MDFGLGRLKQQVSGLSSGLAHANRVAECCVSDSGRGKRAGDDITENQMFRRAVRAAPLQNILCCANAAFEVLEVCASVGIGAARSHQDAAC